MNDPRRTWHVITRRLTAERRTTKRLFFVLARYVRYVHFQQWDAAVLGLSNAALDG